VARRLGFGPLPAIVLALVLWGPPAGAQAPAGPEQEAPRLPVPSETAGQRQRFRAMASRAEARLQALERERATLAARERGVLADLRRLELERETREAELAVAEAAVGEARAEHAAAEAHMAGLRAQVAREQPDVGRGLGRFFQVCFLDSARWLLGVDSVRAAGRRHRQMSALAVLDRARFVAYGERLAALAEEEAHLAAHARELAGRRDVAAVARAAAAEASARQAALVSRIASRRELSERLAGELAGALADLDTRIEDVAQASSTVLLPLAPFKGDLEWPLRGGVAGRFGRVAQSRFGTVVRRNGIDLAAPEGFAVRAVHDGRVAFAEPFTGYGRLIIVDHGGNAFSLYGHLGSLYVARGQMVAAGTALGSVGRAPGGEPSLYFELRIDGRPVDPLQWLKRP
jgi:murein hydrolase activator